MFEHTNQHTTPLKRLYNVILNQYRPSPTRGCQHPPRVAWGHPGTRATQGIAGTSRPGIHGRPGTPETGVPGASKHTRQHTSPVLCAGSQHTRNRPGTAVFGSGLNQSRSLLLEPMVSASPKRGCRRGRRRSVCQAHFVCWACAGALRHKAPARSLPGSKWRKNEMGRC